jgi:hypothetical protein
MIDTVKLLIPFNARPEWIARFRQLRTLDATSGVSKTNINPSSGYKMAGIYLPRLTYTERPSQDGRTYKLAIELSLPKLLYGNNFSEVTETDFDGITKKLSELLYKTYDIWLTANALATSDVGRIDYCKNIVFADYTPVSTIVGSMRTADISKTYDVQKTDFKNGGHIWHIHTNSLDVAMYDKVADLKQEKVSPKRSHEKDGYAQMNILEPLLSTKCISVARYEVRLNSVNKIRTELKAVGFLGGTTFQELYSTDLSRKILLKHWNNVFSKIPKALLDTDTPEQLLLNIAKSNPDIKAREALAIMGIRLLANGMDERYLRNLLEQLFTPSQYRRLKAKSREPPPATQLKTLIKVTDILTAMKPIRIEDYC